MADGLFSGLLNTIDSAKRGVSNRFNMLVDNPREYLAQIEERARDFRQAQKAGLFGMRAEYTGASITPEQQQAQQYADQQMLDLTLGFANPSPFKTRTALPNVSIPKVNDFEKWFGKSAIVEPSGIPQKMYHGTAADIEAFRPGNTIYVTPSPKFAESYGGTQTPNIMPLYVKANKPFNYENPADIQKLAETYKKLHGEDLFAKKTVTGAKGEIKLSQLDKNPISQRLKSGDWTIIEDKKVQDAIKKAGFDAFYIEEGGVKNLGVYDPTQLKSVFNKGTFNPKDPRLLAGALPLIPKQEPVDLMPSLEYRDPFAPTF